MRLAAKVDANQAEIVRVLRDARCTVQHLHMVGNGCPDVLVFSPYAGRMVLLEIKDGSQPPSRRKLTKAEARFHATWPADVHIVSSPDDALRAVGAL